MSNAKEQEAFAQRTNMGSNGAPAGSAVPGVTYNTVTRPGPCAVPGPIGNPTYCGAAASLPGRLIRDRSLLEAYLLWFILGLIGGHHFYLRRPAFGVLYFFTFGLLGCGYLIDLFRMPYLVKEENKKHRDPAKSKRVNISDAYTLWFPFGLLGFHHFYLNKPGFGVLYFFTLGGFGIGWLIDLFRIPSLVKQANEESLDRREKGVCTAYAIGVSPLGFLGGHHFYLKRPVFGLVYFFTFGICGIGYIVDWFRMPVLVKRTNKNINEGDDGKRYLDDAYVLWFPLGLIGAHHFYLRRPVWGLLYFLTFGLMGVGWIVDGFRMPCLVSDVNKEHENRRKIIASSGGHIGVVISTPGMASPTTEGHGAPVFYPTVTQHQAGVAPYPRQQDIVIPPQYQPATAPVAVPADLPPPYMANARPPSYTEQMK